MKNNRKEFFNLKNRECQRKFKEATKVANNYYNLSSVFDSDDDLNTLINTFIKKLDKVIHKCFRKMRVTEKKDDEKDQLYKRWKLLKNKTDEKSKDEFKEVENTLSEKYSKEYYEKIKERTWSVDSEDGGLIMGSLWNLKKELFPQSR